MDTQFDNEDIGAIPDPTKKYYCSQYTLSMGFTYLMKLVLLTQKYPELINQIKNYKNEINKTNVEGWTPLMIACRNCQFYSSVETVQELLLCGADVNMQNKDYCTAIMYAIIRFDSDSNLQTIEMLINAGANLNSRDMNGLSVLTYICNGEKTRYKHPDFLRLIKIIVNAKVNLNIQNNEGDTPLILACKSIVYDDIFDNIIKILIDFGADANMTNKEKKCALYYYLKAEGTKLLNYIMDKSNMIFTDKTNIHYLVNTDNHNVINKLYDIYKNDLKMMRKISLKLSDQEYLNWCSFVSNLNKINNSIIKYRNNIYEKPGNIISLCTEVLFNKKQGKYDVPNKLKFLFDIKDEMDCMNKIFFYLQ